MVKLILSLLLLSIFCLGGFIESASGARHSSRSLDYIKKSCRETRYPALCVRSLSGFARHTAKTPEQLAQISLTVSLYRAQYTRSYLLKVEKELKVVKAREWQAVRDCLVQISESVDQLSQSIKELHRLIGQDLDGDYSWHISNVETWEGSALTNAFTCINDEYFSGRRMSKLKATIKGKVLNVAQVTSNALALFHRYAAAHRAKVNKP